MSKFKSKSKLQLFLFCLTLFMAKSGFYLWEVNDYMIEGLFKYSDIGIIFSLVWSIYVIVNYGLLKSNFTRFINLFTLLTLISAFTAFYYFGQNIFRGIMCQRIFFTYIFCFFPIIILLKKSVIDYQDIITLLLYFAAYELIVTTLQYLVLDKFTFLTVKMGSRYDSNRIYFNNNLVTLASFISLNHILKGRLKFKYVFIIIGTFFYIFIVTKMRANSLVFTLTIFGMILLYGKINRKKLFVLSLGFLSIFYLANTVIFQDILYFAQHGESPDKTLEFREYGRLIYLNGFIESPIVGKGHPSIANPKAFNTAAGKAGLNFFSDNGIFGFAYSYGIFGLMWVFSLFYRAIKRSWKSRKLSYYNYAYLFYFIFSILNPITDFGWFWGGPFFLITALALFDYNLIRIAKYDNSKTLACTSNE